MQRYKNNISWIEQRVIIYKRRQVFDSTGGYTVLWHEWGTLWAQISPVMSAPNPNYPRYKVRFRRGINLPTPLRLSWRGRVYESAWQACHTPDKRWQFVVVADTQETEETENE